jgi:hypothetical protein
VDRQTDSTQEAVTATQSLAIPRYVYPQVDEFNVCFCLFVFVLIGFVLIFSYFALLFLCSLFSVLDISHNPFKGFGEGMVRAMDIHMPQLAEIILDG